MEGSNKSLLTHVGFDNFIVSDQIVALFDARISEAKRIVSEARDKGYQVFNLTRGRKAWVLLVLTGNRFVISAIPMKKITKRLGFLPDGEEPITLKQKRRNKKLSKSMSTQAKMALHVLNSDAETENTGN